MMKLFEPKLTPATDVMKDLSHLSHGSGAELVSSAFFPVTLYVAHYHNKPRGLPVANGCFTNNVLWIRSFALQHVHKLQMLVLIAFEWHASESTE